MIDKMIERSVLILIGCVLYFGFILPMLISAKSTELVLIGNASFVLILYITCKRLAKLLNSNKEEDK